MGRVRVQIADGVEDEELVKALLLVLDRRGICPTCALDAAADNAGVELHKARSYPSMDRGRTGAEQHLTQQIMAFYEERVIPSMVDGIMRILARPAGAEA